MVNNADQTFFTQLILWTTANGISMVSCWALLLAISLCPKCRSSPFNLYLAFSILPDAYKNLSGFIANLTNMLKDEGSANACRVIGWNDAYWWCCNLWMSFTIFRQLHMMLEASKRLERHNPPSAKRITVQSLTIHACSMIMATLTLIPVDWIPKATGGSGCEAYPEAGNRGQTIFYWLFFLPATALIPTFLVTCLCFDIWRRKLLPVNGKSRSLLFYFARLLAVIYIVAIAVIISYLFGGWVQAIAFVVFNLTGFFSVCLALLKKDVKKAWILMWTCKSPEEVIGYPSESTVTNHEGAPDSTSTFTLFRVSRTHRFRLTGSLRFPGTNSFTRKRKSNERSNKGDPSNQIPGGETTCRGMNMEKRNTSGGDGGGNSTNAKIRFDADLLGRKREIRKSFDDISDRTGEGEDGICGHGNLQRESPTGNSPSIPTKTSCSNGNVERLIRDELVGEQDDMSSCSEIEQGKKIASNVLTEVEFGKYEQSKKEDDVSGQNNMKHCDQEDRKKDLISVNKISSVVSIGIEAAAEDVKECPGKKERS